MLLLRISAFLFVFILGQGISALAQDGEVLSELDKTIEKSNYYDGLKEKRINDLKLRLNKAGTPEERYQNYFLLAQEYYVYKSDSAKHFTRLSLATALRLNDVHKINDSSILLASAEAKAGIFPEVLRILFSMDKSQLTNEQLINYYKTYSEYLIYELEYLQDEAISDIISKRIEIRDSLIAILPHSSLEYAINMGTKNIELRNYSQAESILLARLPDVRQNTREYSILTAIIAYLYEQKKDTEKQKYYLALSAISDIRSAVKENLSLRSLATILYSEDDYIRANNYIKQSLDDANFYNSRLRNIQISRVLPIIDKAYDVQKQKQENKLRGLLALLTMLLIILGFAIYLIFRQMKKVAKAKESLDNTNHLLIKINDDLTEANRKEKDMNLRLSEANLVKEQYIHSFLEICTEYIHKLESFKSVVHRKLKSGQTAEILKYTETEKGSSKELKELYKNFDKAFLNVYPYFEEEVNKLLLPDERYSLKGDSLNQELRIYALIRLGIVDNNQIATFLHYTLRTVYNYRSKVKQKAIDPDGFEEKIMKIGLI